jgi:hypothetical protein
MPAPFHRTNGSVGFFLWYKGGKQESAMEAFEQAVGNRHEYQMKASQKTILIVLGAGSFVGMNLY